jgi:homoserine kinase type II
LGIKTTLTKDDLKSFFEVSSLVETTHGVSDTVYIVDDRYVLKVFEEADEEVLQNEIDILNLCKNIQVARLKKEIFYVKGKVALLYKKCDGTTLLNPTTKSIKQIGKFLKKFHYLTKCKSNTNQNLFEKDRVFSLIEQIGLKKFKDIFESLNLELKDDGIIHGDLFVDNAIFKDQQLSCVIDFSESCVGDFYFDLAVVAVSWCKNDQEIMILLDAYGTNIELEYFKEYMKYALLYYSVTRYLDRRDYSELLERIQCI